jgi:hypothetical protein
VGVVSAKLGVRKSIKSHPGLHFPLLNSLFHQISCAASYSFKGFLNKYERTGEIFLKYYRKTRRAPIRATTKPGLFEWLAGTTR